MPGFRRRTLLRTLCTGPVAALLAGCNDSSDNTSPSDDESPNEEFTGRPRTSSTPARSPVPSTPTQSGNQTPTSPGRPKPTAAPTDPATVSGSPTESPEPSPVPAPTSTGTPALDVLAQRAREFVADLDDGAFERAHDRFTEAYAPRLSRTTLIRYWFGLTAQHGSFREVTDVERSTREETETVLATVACTQGDAPIELAFGDEGIAGLWFPTEYSPPAYADESAFIEREVSVDVERCPLPATVTVPEDADGDENSTPGAVLVHGSGRKDRNETIGPNEPFRDLAWGLASRGVAVLRYEKRTNECTVPLPDWTIDDIVVDDAVRALETLRDVGAVCPDATVVVGHSLGGTCTPRILERAGSVAGGAMLAANARPITEISVDQVRHYFEVDGEFSATDKQRLERLQRAFDQLESGAFRDGEVIEGFPAAWWTSLLEYDQVGAAQSVSAPLWIGQGGRDFQVPADEDFDRWQSELAGRPDTQFERYPDLSHLFHPGFEPSLREEYVFHDNVASAVVADLAEWIESTTA